MKNKLSNIHIRNAISIIAIIFLFSIIFSCKYYNSSPITTTILSETKWAFTDAQTNPATPIPPTVMRTPSISDQYTLTNTSAFEPFLWTNITPNGGVIYDLDIDPLTPSTLYALTKVGLFRSIDSGGEWEIIGNPEASNITIDPVTPSILYANSQHDMKKSVDGGINWKVISNYSGNDLAIDPSNPSTLYCLSYYGLKKSTNGGEEWISLNLSGGGTDLAIDPLTTTTIYVGGSGGYVYKSTDGGENWVEVKPALQNIFNQTTTFLAIDPVAPTTIYAGVFGDGVYKSTNGGESWRAINNGLTNGYMHSLEIDPSRPSIIYAGGLGGLFKSANGGATWRKVDTSSVHDEINSLIIDTKNTNTVYAGTIGGVVKSTDVGENWISVNSGINIPSNVQSIAIDPKNPTTLYSGILYRGIFKSTNSGIKWNEVYIGGSASRFPFILLDPNKPSILYVRNFEYLMKSINGGNNWAFIGGFYGEHGPELNSLAIDPISNNILYAGIIDRNDVFEGIILKSINGGENWRWLYAGLPEKTMVTALVIDYTNNNIIYAGTWGNGVFKSVDGGENWIAANVGLPQSNISSLSIDPMTPTTLYAGTFKDGVYKSIDGGINWYTVNTGLYEGIDVEDLIIDPQMPNILYICISDSPNISNYGVYKSKDAGENWKYIGLGDSKVYDLAIDPIKPTTIYAATDKGLFSIS